MSLIDESPVAGPLCPAIARDHATSYGLLVILLTLLVLAVKTWGLVGLTLTATATVPLMFLFLLTIARP